MKSGLMPSTLEINLKGVNTSVTYHHPCHLNRAQALSSEPLEILKSIPGVEYIEMKDADRCCGGGGTYSITHYKTAIKINNHKIKNIKDSGAGTVATSCPSCTMHIQDNMLQHNMSGKVRFVVEILADSLKDKA